MAFLMFMFSLFAFGFASANGIDISVCTHEDMIDCSSFGSQKFTGSVLYPVERIIFNGVRQEHIRDVHVFSPGCVWYITDSHPTLCFDFDYIMIVDGQDCIYMVSILNGKTRLRDITHLRKCKHVTHSKKCRRKKNIKYKQICCISVNEI